MSTPAEDARLREWLRNQEDTPAYLEEIVGRTRLQPQRRRWRLVPGALWPGLPDGIRVGLAAACLIAAVVVTANLVPRGTQPSVGDLPSEPPAPVVTAQPSLVGTVLRNTTFEAPFTITIPDGWTVREGYEPDVFITRQLRPGTPDDPLTALRLMVVRDVAADPCVQDGRRREPPIGESAADLADWLVSIEQLRPSAPVPVVVAGFDALRVDTAFKGSPECPVALLWHNEPGIVFPEETKRFYIFQVGEVRIAAVVARIDPEADIAMAEAILQSLKFE
jgi:hypothetical protein